MPVKRQTGALPKHIFPVTPVRAHGPGSSNTVVNEQEIPSLTFSAGISQFSSMPMFDKVIAADRAVYRAKNRGRAQIVISSDDGLTNSG